MQYLILFLICLSTSVKAETSTNQKDFTVNFGADAYVRGFTVNKDKAPDKKEQGIAQLIRVKLDIASKEGLALRTRTVLSGDKWEGDTANGVTGNSDDGGGGNAVRLDYGFLEYVKDDWTFKIGRQSADWANCLNTCDDRRDRALVIKKLGSSSYGAVVYDKRFEGLIDKDGDDGEMYGALFLDFGKYHEWGVLLAWWQNNDDSYLLNRVWNVAPYLKFKRNGLELNVLYNWLGQGRPGSLFPGHHHVGSVQIAKTFYKDIFKIEAQNLMIINGGYLTSGFDTYLSMVNNNPDHNQSNINALQLGGLGTFTGGKNHRDTLYSTRLTYHHSKDLSLGLASGYMKFFKLAQATRLESYAFDATFSYQVATRAKIKASFGRLNGDIHLSAGSLGVYLDY